jgi:hypothetical protein
VTTTTFVRAALALVVLAAAACGADGKKTRQACDGDEQCNGGVCFESECYAACTDQSACAEDEFCVMKPRGDDSVNVCVVAAEFAPCVARTDCDDLVATVCHSPLCRDDGTCGFEPLSAGVSCETGQGPGVCDATNACVASGGTCGDGACGAGEDCVSCPGDCTGCVAGYLWTFDDGVTQGFASEVTADPWQAAIAIQAVEGGSSFLGAFGKQTVHLVLGSGPIATAAAGNLPTGALPTHDTVRLTFDLLVIGSWDGHAATDGATYASMPDTWTWGVPAIEEGNSYSFSNCVEDVQTWPEPFAAGASNAVNPAKNGAESVEPILTLDGCGDATYHVTFTFAHHDAAIDLIFLGNPNEYEQSRNLANESWGLDNVKVELLCAACGS